MKRGLRAAMFAAAICALPYSCDLLRGGDFEVESWRPGPGYLDGPGAAVVAVRFSRTPDRTSAERAFRFEADSLEVPGGFEWRGLELVYLPCEPLVAGRDYRITVSTAAEADDGLSLDKDFIAAFTTRFETSRPRVVSVEPVDRAVVDDPYAPIVVRMSEAMDADSFRAAAGLSPGAEGAWSASDGVAVMTFRPLSPWRTGERYEFSLGTGAKDESGNALASEFRSCFDAGSDRIPPGTPSARAVVPAGDASVELAADDPDDGVITVTHGWESDWGFAVLFDEPVLRESALARISTEPSLSPEALPGDRYASEFRFSVGERARRDEAYSLVVGSGIEDASGNASKRSTTFRFSVDGPNTAPPSVLELRFRINPESPTPAWQSFHPDDAFSALDTSLYSATGIEYATAVDIVLALAQAQVPDLMTFRGAFGIETTNSCATISVRSASLVDPGTYDPPPPEGCSVIRAGLAFSNKVNPGIVTFVLGSSFADGRGTRIAREFRLPVVK
ncbi:MAG: Ig-like domain-containing protein [Spirochaetes bacterium]|nr:Ig-like domain-containing protein [Spirochaetota bacterium]